MTAAEREKSASPNLLPSLLRTPPRSRLSRSPPPRLLGGESRFLASRKKKKMEPASAEEKGGRRRGRPREPADMCNPAVASFPPQPGAGRGRGRGASSASRPRGPAEDAA